ncbi:MAG: hypothetical protein VR70_01180 [Rhodospirillaceae bacterium BRH_c57]|nr:MAG: hypothetical protein VR70_01180 [Rhodospirillaceae bacterium BRH_c57]
MISLELFIAGTAANSSKALNNLKRALADLEIQVELAVVDVLHEPKRAWESGVLVTPMLVRRTPAPTQMLLGSMDDVTQVAAFIGATT